MSRGVTSVLVAINAVLLLGIAALWLAGSTSWAPPPAVAPDPAILAPLDAPGHDAGHSVERIVARPLFAADRRPMVAEAEPAKQEAAGATQITDNLDGMRLTGLVGEGRSAQAIVDDEGTSRRLTVGQRIDGWRLDAVEPGAALFSGPDGRSRRLEMSRPSLFSGEDAPRGAPAAAERQTRNSRAERVRERLSRAEGDKDERREGRRSARNQDRSDR